MDRLPTERDLKVLSWQLGRPARGVAAIAVTCSYGYPQVTVNQLLLRRRMGFELFPNLFWLSCPYLVQEVGRVEAGGGVRAAEQKIKDEPAFAEEYFRAHRAYREERRRLFSGEDEAFLRSVGAEAAADSGVGGLRNFRRVKCLHAQLAHFLARGTNPVGERVAAGLLSLACAPDDVRCRAGLRPPEIGVQWDR